MENITIATNPRLYRACQKFFAAGCKRKPHPSLTKFKVAERPPLKEAYAVGREQYEFEMRLEGMVA